MEKNEERVGIVCGLGMNGEGIIKENDGVVFLPFSIPGEKVKYKILKVKKDIAYGKVLDVLTPADERIRPVCSVFTKCGGCQLQHIRYANQLKLKENNIATCFKKIAGLDIVVKPTVKGDKEYRYRNT